MCHFFPVLIHFWTSQKQKVVLKIIRDYLKQELCFVSGLYKKPWLFVTKQKYDEFLLSICIKNDDHGQVG